MESLIGWSKGWKAMTWSVAAVAHLGEDSVIIVTEIVQKHVTKAEWLWLCNNPLGLLRAEWTRGQGETFVLSQQAQQYRAVHDRCTNQKEHSLMIAFSRQLLKTTFSNKLLEITPHKHIFTQTHFHTNTFSHKHIFTQTHFLKATLSNKLLEITPHKRTFMFL